MSIAVVGSAGTKVASSNGSGPTNSFSGAYTPSSNDNVLYVLCPMVVGQTLSGQTLTWRGGTSGLTELCNGVDPGNAYRYIGIWRITSPGATEGTLVWTAAGTGTVQGEMVVYECSGVDVTNPETVETLEASSATSLYREIATVAGDLVIDALALAVTLTDPASSQQYTVAEHLDSTYGVGTSVALATGSATTMMWTWGDFDTTRDWAAIIVKAISGLRSVGSAAVALVAPPATVAGISTMAAIQGYYNRMRRAQ